MHHLLILNSIMTSVGSFFLLFSDCFTGAEQIIAPTLSICRTVCMHAAHAGVRTRPLMHAHEDNVHIWWHAEKHPREIMHRLPLDRFTELKGSDIKSLVHSPMIFIETLHWDFLVPVLIWVFYQLIPSPIWLILTQLVFDELLDSNTEAADSILLNWSA